MNADMLRRVASAIDQNPDNYNQSLWLDDENGLGTETDSLLRLSEGVCGTQGCIAGWAVAIRYASVDPEDPGDDFRDRWLATPAFEQAASQIFDLPIAEADMLFDPMWRPRSDLTVSDALRTLADGAHVIDVSSREFLVEEQYLSEDFGEFLSELIVTAVLG
jgi:hypothetical protein